MGNSSSLRISAGIQLDDSHHELDQTSGIRRRNIASKTNLCASIIEDGSGAYISRSVFHNRPTGLSQYAIPSHDSASGDTRTNTRLNVENFTLTSSIANDTVDDHRYDQRFRQLDAQDLATDLTVERDNTISAMKDSGYLDIETSVASATSSQDHYNDFALTGTPLTLSPSCDELSTFSQREASEGSSLSDQQLRDLGTDNTFSDLSSCKGSNEAENEADLDEDVIHVEIEELNGCISDGDSFQPLLSLTLNDDGSTESSIASGEATLTSETDCGSLNYPLQHHSSTENSGLLLQSSPQSSCCSPFSQRKYNDTSRPSSVLSSPLLGAISGHSRSSSITSADIDLEASSFAECCNEVGKINLIQQLTVQSDG